MVKTGMYRSGLYTKEGEELTVQDAGDLLSGMISINRIEVIDSDGRSYVNWQPRNKMSISIQDYGKTIKIFTNEEQKTN